MSQADEYPTTVAEAGRFLASEVLRKMNAYSLPVTKENEAVAMMVKISGLHPDEGVCQVAHRLLFSTLHTPSPTVAV